MLEKVGKFEQAAQDYSKAIELEPGAPDPYNRRAICYRQLNQGDQALADLNRAIELRPDFAEAYVNRANSYAVTAGREQALKDFAKAIELDPKLGAAYYNRAVLYWQMRRYDNAWADVRAFQQLGGKPEPKFIQALSESSGRSP